jgi:HSP20 family molecular chaperone IbpA
MARVFTNQDFINAEDFIRKRFLDNETFISKAFNNYYSNKREVKEFKKYISFAGLSKEDININVKDRVIYVQTNPKELTDYNKMYENYEVKYELTDEHDFDNMGAKMINGLLTLFVPLKSPEDRNFIKVEIK